MRKASRLFEIIQILRLSGGPVTAARIARDLNVTPRSIYRDIVALQRMGIPIQGGRGIGYVMRPGFDLPPLMFSIDEMEAIVLALALLGRTGDVALKEAARGVRQKITGAIPAPLRQALNAKALYAWGSVAPSPSGIDLAMLRGAIRDEQTVAIAYRDEHERESMRMIRPLALIYYSENTNIVAWCEARQDFRTFRSDRVTASELSERFFKGEGEDLRRRWVAGWHSDEPNKKAGAKGSG